MVACIDNSLTIGTQRVTGDESRRCSDVDTGLENSNHVIDIGPFRVVDHAVRIQAQQRIDVVCRKYANGIEAAQFPDISSDFVGPPCITTDNFEFRIGNSGDHRSLTNIAGRPLHNSIDT
ncbi:unannotated protein [freshwater metagenome]|uniref:Unannotated protein n=1 Tax=freshwater metagenome TaxID=449393 RepID=A0A6J6GZS4_9ZZZZ